MRRVLLLLVGLLLAGVGQGAFAAVFTWGNGLVTSGGDCYLLALEEAHVDEKIGYSKTAGTNGHAFTAWRVLSASGFARSVGDVCHYSVIGDNDAGAAGSFSISTPLSSIVEDDVLDDVAHAATQRVLVMVGSFLMFGLGWIAGK